MLKYKHLKAGNALYSVVEEMRKDINWDGVAKRQGVTVGSPCLAYAVLISDRLAERYPEREIYPVFGAMVVRYSKHKSGCVNFGTVLKNKSYHAHGAFKGHAWIEMKAGGRTFWIDATLGSETRDSVRETDDELGIDTCPATWPFDSVTIFEAKQSGKKEFEQVRDAYKPMFAYWSEGKNEELRSYVRDGLNRLNSLT